MVDAPERKIIVTSITTGCLNNYKFDAKEDIFK
jgi:hypothetical protein